MKLDIIGIDESKIIDHYELKEEKGKSHFVIYYRDGSKIIGENLDSKKDIETFQIKLEKLMKSHTIDNIKLSKLLKLKKELEAISEISNQKLDDEEKLINKPKKLVLDLNNKKNYNE